MGRSNILSPTAIWGLILLLVQSLIRPPQLKFGPDIYWACYWASNYSHGFSRRSFLGFLLWPLGEFANEYWLIAGLSWIFMIALWSQLLAIILKVLQPLPSLFQYIFLTVIILSPAWTGLLIEVVGDPLQVVFFFFIGLLVWLINQNTLQKWQIFVWGIFGFIASLIHEGSAFFILPVLATVVLRVNKTLSDKRVIFWSCFSGLIFGLILIFLFAQKNSFQYQTIDLWDRKNILLSALNNDSGLSFLELLNNEIKNYFQKGIIYGFLKIIAALWGSLLLPFIQSWLICSLICFLNSNDGQRVKCRPFNIWCQWYGLPLLLILPLWVIAHDWGRFAGYILMLQTVALFLIHLKQFTKLNIVESWVFNRAPRLLLAQLFLGSLILAMCTSPQLGGYRIYGLFEYRHYFFSVTVLGTLFFCLGAFPSLHSPLKIRQL